MKKTHKMRKIMLALFSAMLLVCVTVGATVAYLTSSDTVTNTFTVGNVAITLDEAKVNDAGQPVDNTGAVVAVANAPRVDKNTYKLMPGHTYTKDPTIHVASTSEDCWLFVKVENGISNIEASGSTTIASQMATNGWTLVDGTSNVYGRASASSKGENVVVFSGFTVDGNANVANYTNATVVVTAYAIQADGFNSAAAAWTAAGSSFTPAG